MSNWQSIHFGNGLLGNFIAEQEARGFCNPTAQVKSVGLDIDSKNLGSLGIGHFANEADFPADESLDIRAIRNGRGPRTPAYDQ
jgi:hypothetical protein